MCPSGAAFTIPLGLTNPWLIVMPRKPDLSACRVFTRIVVTCANILLPNAPEWLTPLLHCRLNTLLPLVDFIEEATNVCLKFGFVEGLEPHNTLLLSLITYELGKARKLKRQQRQAKGSITPLDNPKIKNKSSSMSLQTLSFAHT